MYSDKQNFQTQHKFQNQGFYLLFALLVQHAIRVDLNRKLFNLSRQNQEIELLK